MARPKKDLDGEQVYKLARLGCTQEEIADVLGCSRAVIGARFQQEYSSARASLKTSLRRAQVLRAVRDKSDTMLIHLGKAYLGQGEKQSAPDELDDTTPHDEDGNKVDA